MKRILIFIFLLIASFSLWYFYTKWESKGDDNEIVLYGNVDVRQVDLGFRVSGRVIEMPFQEGDLVEENTLVGVLDDQPYLDQLHQAKATLSATQVSLANAEILLKRRMELIQDGSVSQEDLDNAKASKESLDANIKQAEANVGVATTNLNDTKIFAPTKGIILTRIREPGTVVKAADPIYTLSLFDPIWVRAFIPEPLLGFVYPGMDAQVFTDTKGGKAYKGHVGFISPVAEFTPKNVETTNLRTDLVYRLRIIVENPDFGLRQGMPVTVKLAKNENNIDK